MPKTAFEAESGHTAPRYAYYPLQNLQRSSDSIRQSVFLVKDPQFRH